MCIRDSPTPAAATEAELRLRFEPAALGNEPMSKLQEAGQPSPSMLHMLPGRGQQDPFGKKRHWLEGRNPMTG
eukprot:2833817-Alexandrium_andersonii.AAC.1